MTAAARTPYDRPAAPRLDRLANRLAYGLVLIHVLALASLVFLLMAAGARAEDVACGARDLVGELKKSDPAAYARLEAEGAKIANSGYRFWKIEKDGQKPDWLLGTNYGFLRAKPVNASLIDFLSPWPWYLPELVVIGIASALLCYAPFFICDLSAGRTARRPAVSPP